MNDDLSGFNDWSVAFADWSDVSISELHGLMSALMVACEPTDVAGWELLLTELSFAVPSQTALSLLSDYAEDVSFALKDKDDAYAFEPLLPDDEHDLSERLLALKDWAGGFITGLGVAEILLATDEQEQIRDLAKIASLCPSDLEDVDSDEEEYLQLFEFARFVPVSLARPVRKKISDLALIKGLAPDRLTAGERQSLPHVTNATLPKHEP